MSHTGRTLLRSSNGRGRRRGDESPLGLSRGLGKSLDGLACLSGAKHDGRLWERGEIGSSRQQQKKQNRKSVISRGKKKIQQSNCISRVAMDLQG
jgi:hypothetical protein